MVIGRKPKKIDIRIKGESIDQVDSFKYLGCNISSNMNCCQEVKQRIAMAKELWKNLVNSFVWSVALYGEDTWTLRRNEQKELEAFEMWVWRRMERVKWTEKIKNAVVLERVGEGRIMLKLIRKRKKKLAGTLAKKELPAEGCSRRYGKREESSRQKNISDDRQHYDKWTV